MRALLALSLPHLSEESIWDVAGFISLLLTVVSVLWPKFVGLMRTIWLDLVSATEAVREFRTRLRHP